MNKGRSKESTYFTEAMRHRTVEDFTVSYINRKITVDTMRDKPVFTNDTDDLSDKLASISDALTYRREYGGVVREQVFRARVPDERFESLNELVDKQARRIKIPDEQRQAVEDELYGFIILLMREGRISGDFHLQPAQSAEIEKFVNLISNLEKRVSGLENIKKGITP